MISKTEREEDGTCTFPRLEGEYQDWIYEFIRELTPSRRKIVRGKIDENQ